MDSICGPGHPALAAIIEALGLPTHTRSLVLRFDVESPARVSIEYYPDAAAIARLASVFETYRIKAVADPHPL